MIRFTITATLIVALYSFVLAQNCTPNPNPTPGPDCFSAPFNCCGEIDGMSGTLPAFLNPNGPSPLCPGSSSTPNNMEWLTFAAGSSSITFQIEFTNCTETGQGAGAQIGVYTDCGFTQAVYCNGNQNIGPVLVPLNNLIIGEVYHLFFDGWNGSVCDYLILVTSGSTFSQEPQSPQNISGPLNVCSGVPASYFTPLPVNTSDIFWELSPALPFLDNGNSITVTDWSTAVGGTVEICATGLNECYTDATAYTPTCITVNIADNPEINVFGSYCQNEGGYLFAPNGQVYTIGVHQVAIPNPPNCDDVYILTIEAFPNTILDSFIVLCPGEPYVIDGVPYFPPATNLPLPTNDVDANGCDQIINLTLSAIDTAVNIVASSTVLNCDDNSSEAILTAIVNFDPSITYFYDWNTADGCILGSSNTLTVITNCGGTYSLVVTMETTDDNGIVICNSQEVTIDILDNGSPFTVDITATPQSCMDDGSAMAMPSGSGTFTYIWSNSQLTQTIENLEPGTYIVTVNNDLGCEAIDSVEIEAPFILEVSSTVTDCNTDNGSATALVSGGIVDASYAWSTGATTAVINNLAPGWYSVTVEDNTTNCRTHKNIQVKEDNICFVRISGYVLVDDEEQDCVEDSGTIPANLVRVELSDGQIEFTNADGYYEFITDAGEYDITIFPNMNIYEDLCVDPITVDAATWGNTYADNIFYLKASNPTDMRVKVVKPNARPGFSQRVRICLMNRGAVPVSGTLTFTHPEILEFLSSSPEETTYDQASQTMTWEYTDIPPGAVWIYYPKLMIPVGTDLGTPLTYDFLADPVTGDINPADNSESCTILVTGSYDPNDKAVNPAGEGPQGFIERADSSLSYTIRFQNTGTDTAFTVLIRDTLDADLNVRTFDPGPASHPYTASIKNGNVVEFLFENILLPDSTVNEEASNGFVIFDIKLNPDPEFGTVYENRAGIFFDFNPPIITNTVVNTILMPVAIPEISSSEIPLRLLPNPNRGFAQLQYSLAEAEIVNINLFDLLGNRVALLESSALQSAGSHQIDITTQTLGAGIYFVKIETADGEVGTIRMIKL